MHNVSYFVKMAETRFTHPTKVSRPAFTIPKEKKKKPIAPIPGPSDYDTAKNEHKMTVRAPNHELCKN